MPLEQLTLTSLWLGFLTYKMGTEVIYLTRLRIK